MTGEDLKKAVLQAAVQGKLSERCETDTPAVRLLRDIRAKRAELAAAKQIKLPKDGESIIYRDERGDFWEQHVGKKGEVLSDACIEGEIPFDIPGRWQWTRLESVIELISGVDLNPNDYNDERKGIPYLTGASNFEGGLLIENRWTESPRRISIAGDLLFTCKGTVGEMAINTFEEAHIARQIMAIRPFVPQTLPFVRRYLQVIASQVKASATGIIPGIDRSTLLRSLIPIPPLEEQERIVAELDEVMPLIEEYGRLQEQRDRLDAELPEKLRKAILQAGVEGKLSERLDSDTPASELLSGIRTKRRELAASKQIRFPKKGESIIYRDDRGDFWEQRVGEKGEVLSDTCIAEEIPFEIPGRWQWARLGAIATFGGGGTPDKSERTHWGGGIPWASMKDIHGEVLRSTIDTITEEGLRSKASISICEPGDLIVSTRLNPGKSIISGIRTAINQDLKAVWPIGVEVPYLHCWFKANLGVFMKLGSGTTVPGIKLQHLESALIPVPPIEEQERIVAKLGEVMPLVDGLRG